MAKNGRTLAQRLLITLIATGLSLTHVWAQPTIESPRTPRLAIMGLRPAVNAVEVQVLEGMHDYFKNQPSITLIDNEITNNYITRLELQQSSSAFIELKSAAEAFKQGREAYDQLQLEAAQKAFSTALKIYQDNMTSIETNKDMLQARLYLAMTTLQLGDEVAAENMLRTLLRSDIAGYYRILDSKEFSPAIAQRLDKLRQQLAGSDTAQLTIESDQAGAIVWLDGQRLGVTPYTAEKIFIGEHDLQVHKRGYERVQMPLNLRPGINRQQIILKRSVLFGPVNSNPFADENLAPIYRALVQATSAELIVLATAQTQATSTDVQVQLLSSDSGVFTTSYQSSITDANQANAEGGKLARMLLRHLSATAELLPTVEPLSDNPDAGFIAMQPQDSGFIGFNPTAVPTRKTGNSKFDFARNPIFWGMVGGVVMATGLGVLLFSDIGRPDASNNVLVIDNPRN